MFKAGEIWLTKFHPGTSNELAKYRPALVVRNLDEIDKRFVLIAPLTSSKKQNDFEVEVSHPGLEKRSTILPWYLWTIDTRRLQHKIGELSNEDRKKVSASLQKLQLNPL